ncbi:Stp1/IreP family PP2C-type Ser/Thr phosphatase [Anabaena sp. FACHB-1237]|uniref:Stp1/IreP family PP2C-type Ser/Thr phosphatase n=1 Tax=Anabaena sp. FACHB-1237 TaxID=2692769 RepID=UPI001680DDC9|nr:Stp1/IreP family PP2C-type Ser/Thr phosphatase [Anabaena sp. FACHB-1237]MBD2139005.1 Stp1/IreP family PP2C-type Ser/Thr phosphatase [Anabaena sp. FACHB-1237]
MKLTFTGLTDRGIIRSNNQDSYHCDSNNRFFIVADGMGGHAGGEEASRIATQEINSYLSTHWQSPQTTPQLLEDALLMANEAILADQQANPQRSDMGTTVVVVAIRDNSAFCAHIGDSRIYRLRYKEIEQLTEDHTWVAKAIKMGDISAEEARIHPFRHVLSQCLGREDLHQYDISPIDIQAGDRLLLCSDGLTEELIDTQISEYIQNSPSLETAAQSLVEGAKKAGGHDNITVVLICVE